MGICISFLISMADFYRIDGRLTIRYVTFSEFRAAKEKWRYILPLFFIMELTLHN